MRLARDDFRQGLRDALIELALPADLQIRRYPNMTPEELVHSFHHVDIDANRAHLTNHELALLDRLLAIVQGFESDAQARERWFDNDWVRDPCWQPVRQLAAALADLLRAA
jgi:hypothetical protein